METNYRNNRQDQDISDIGKHISVLNGEMGDVRSELVKIKTNMDWLKKDCLFIREELREQRKTYISGFIVMILTIVVASFLR